MNLYSRRQYLQGLFATSVFLAVCKDNLSNSEVLVSKAASLRRWKLGIGADPSQLIREVQSNSAVKELVRAWSPEFLAGWLNSFDHKKGDLSFWRAWHKQGLLSAWFSQGYSLQVITWEDDTTLPTGDYHISQQYLEDLEELAGYIRHANPQGRQTYWTLATEFSYWRVPADTYNSTTDKYYQALMQNLLRARATIKRQLPNAWVAPSWGGWIVTFDYPSKGSGRSMIPPFAQMLQQMDGIAFQSMRPRPAGEYNPELQRPDPGNPEQIRQCCKVFSQYTKSLMVSHYEPSIKQYHPNGGRADTVTRDFAIMMHPDWLKTVTRLGLDKFSLMHYGLYKNNPYNALDAAKTFKGVLQEGEWALG
jgi:hypothetical protein